MIKRWLNQFRTAVSISGRTNWVAFVLAIASVSALAVWGAGQNDPPQLNMLDWSPQGYCVSAIEGGNPEAPTLHVYVHESFQGRTLCNELKSEAELARHFSQVRARWVPPPEGLGHAIAKARLHLLLLRHEETSASRQFLERLYGQLAFYPSYEVFLIARDHQPSLTPSYLTSHRIGLLQNNHSWSGYIVPMQEFHTAGVDPGELSVRYYPSHAELRKGLHRGEVDVISSFWDEFQTERRPKWRTHRIGEVASGMGWFLEQSVYDQEEARCALVHALRRVAGREANPYFADLRVSNTTREVCDGR